MLCRATGSYEYIRRFIVEVSGAEKGHGPDAPSALPVYDLLAGSASGELTCQASVNMQAVMYLYLLAPVAGCSPVGAYGCC